MRTYRIKIQLEEMQFLYSSLNALICEIKVLDKINYIEYHNIKSLIRKLYNRLFALSNKTYNPRKEHNLDIDINEYRAFLQMSVQGRELFILDDYLQNLYIRIITQADKQEIQIKEEHKNLIQQTNGNNRRIS